ncbi:cysteine hydrolase [Metapseudomonas furukawaii]|uniref:cysteine hydrolase family protein n=1 Tax=Metapseudomonas furukawaii TaxID=1149133 RepID=UPI00227A0C11|nr:cysteine hydrolase [Pseudomonas furukawaii]WAG81570.1 cysteine hydrolase [Pseudomonas furukawaii]
MVDLDLCRTAVINIHWQHDIVSGIGAFGETFATMAKERGSAAKAKALSEAARAAGVFVVSVRTAFQANHSDLLGTAPLFGMVLELGALIEGTNGVEYIPEMAPAPSDFIVSSASATGFHSTDLNRVLRSRDIDTVLLTGVATNFAVEGTGREAFALGYKTVIVSDATAAKTAEAHEATLENFRLLGWVVTSDELIAAFKSATT